MNWEEGGQRFTSGTWYIGWARDEPHVGQGRVDYCDLDEAGTVGNGLRDVEGDDGLGSVYNQLRQRGGQLTTYEELRQSHRVSSIVAWN
jgi:hypothetical protein